jgi:hypothetical protein
MPKKNNRAPKSDKFCTNQFWTDHATEEAMSINATRESHLKVVILLCVPTELRKWKALDMHAQRFTFKKELN